jgi:hypothetical protein
LTQLLTSDRALPTLLLLNWNLYKWRTTRRVWCVNSISRGVFIGVPGAISDLIKSVIRQVLGGRPSDMDGRPWVTASTVSKLWVPFHRHLGNVTAEETHGRLQCGANRPPTWPTHQRPLHTASSCQVCSRGDTYFGRIPHFLVIS